jgi:hypothetical protein
MQLRQPYDRVLKDLIGGVHNATTATMLAIAKFTKMDPNRTIWADMGCGAPTFALQGSIFNKETYCLDLPLVIDEVLRIFDTMRDIGMMRRLYIRGIDILRMNINQFPDSAKSMTHITLLIGVEEGNMNS